MNNNTLCCELNFHFTAIVRFFIDDSVLIWRYVMHKKLLSLVLALAMLFSFCIIAVGADKTVASSMRLTKAEGTVSVTNKLGKDLTISDKMQLFNGYELKTSLASYAYISLDSSKAVKLDASSEAEVKQSGRKLEIDLKTGKLFFNVTEPVPDDGSMNIRTSTMITGIRGTSGWVDVINQYMSRVFVLSGSVTIYTTDPLTGESKMATIHAGEVGTSYVRMEYGPEFADIVIERFGGSRTPGFAAVAVSNDSALQLKISGDLLPAIISNANERLKADEDAAQKLDDERQAAAVLLPNYINPLFPGQSSQLSPGSGSGSGPVGVPVTLNNPTEAQIQNALNGPPGTIVTITGTTGLLANLTIPPGNTLVNNGTMNFSIGGSLQNFSSGTFINNYRLNGGSGAIINGNPDGTQPGRIILNGQTTLANLMNNPRSTITFAFVPNNNDQGGDITTFTNVAGATAIFESGDVIFGNTIQNSGTIKVEGGDIFSSTASVLIESSGGSITMSSGQITNGLGNTIKLKDGATFEMSGGALISSGAAVTIDSGDCSAVNTGGIVVGAPGGLVGYAPDTAAQINVVIGSSNKLVTGTTLSEIISKLPFDTKLVFDSETLIETPVQPIVIRNDQNLTFITYNDYDTGLSITNNGLISFDGTGSLAVASVTNGENSRFVVPNLFTLKTKTIVNHGCIEISGALEHTDGVTITNEVGATLNIFYDILTIDNLINKGTMNVYKFSKDNPHVFTITTSMHLEAGSITNNYTNVDPFYTGSAYTGDGIVNFIPYP